MPDSFDFTLVIRPHKSRHKYKYKHNYCAISYLKFDIEVDGRAVVVEADEGVPRDVDPVLHDPVRHLHNVFGVLYLCVFLFVDNDDMMLIRSFMIQPVTLPVRLKIESLSGLTDLVVSMTKTRGGLRGRSEAWPSRPWEDWGHAWHLVVNVFINIIWIIIIIKIVIIIIVTPWSSR